MIIATNSPLIDLFIRGLGTLGGFGGGSGIGASSTGGRGVEGRGCAGAGARSAGEETGFFGGSAGETGFETGEPAAGDGRTGGFGAPAATSFIASTIRSVAPSSSSLPEPVRSAAETDAGGGNGLLRISVGRSVPDEEGAGGTGGGASALPVGFSDLLHLLFYRGRNRLENLRRPVDEHRLRRRHGCDRGAPARGQAAGWPRGSPSAGPRTGAPGPVRGIGYGGAGIAGQERAARWPSGSPSAGRRLQRRARSRPARRPG